jgi:hypothetical protein
MFGAFLAINLPMLLPVVVDGDSGRCCGGTAALAQLDLHDGCRVQRTIEATAADGVQIS